MENILYYPYINIPKTDWTSRVLLYYDSVGCIVPQRYFDEPHNYESHMRDLVRDELVIPLNPLESLDNLLDVSRTFFEYILSKEFKLEKRRLKFKEGKNERIHKEKFRLSGTKIHADKFDKDVFYQLEQVGLARRLDYEWFIVEQDTANELMLFLSSVLGAKLNYQPTTDIINKNFSIVGKTTKSSRVLKSEQHVRELILENLIPFPEQIDYSKLRKFKDDHQGLLKKFKNRVELLVLNPDTDINSRFFAESLTELNYRKEELSARMNESRLGSIVLGTVCGITSAIVGFAAGFGFAGLPGFANAIYSALQIEKAEDIFDQSGLKYLALVDKRLRKTTTKRVDGPTSVK